LKRLQPAGREEDDDGGLLHVELRTVYPTDIIKVDEVK
jgi:hypothetical protein